MAGRGGSSRLPRRAVGMAPTSAYKIMRLEYAEFLLRNTDHSVTEIATLTGFCDSSHFVRAFKDRRGMTPSVFRNA